MLQGFKDLMSLKWSGRKLGSLLFFQIQASTFLALGKLSGEQWVTFTTLLFTVFVVGSVYEKGRTTKDDYETGKVITDASNESKAITP